LLVSNLTSPPASSSLPRTGWVLIPAPEQPAIPSRAAAARRASQRPRSRRHVTRYSIPISVPGDLKIVGNFVAGAGRQGCECADVDAERDPFDAAVAKNEHAHARMRGAKGLIGIYAVFILGRA